MRPVGIPQSVWGRIGRNLHLIPNHPVGIVSGLIHFSLGPSFQSLVFPDPVVTTKQAFDDLRVPKDHVLRSPSDTYYVGSKVLRPHATSHQSEVLARLSGDSGAVWTCDVYRNDEVDRIHFPVFHQTDAVRLFDSSVSESEIIADLKKSLTQLVVSLGIPQDSLRWDTTAYFPFTTPSLELELNSNGRWIEVLGCGRIHPSIHPNGWAFGIGLDRLAMLLFGIDDIRTLWSQDVRFLNQFESGNITQFKPFSKYPPISRDTAFFLPSSHSFDVPAFVFSCMQRAGPSGLEQVELVDVFETPKKISRCFRFVYRGIESTLTSGEANLIHEKEIIDYLKSEFQAEIRYLFLSFLNIFLDGIQDW